MAAAPQQPDEALAETRAEQEAAGSLLSAGLLALTGGMLDAFLYLTHDKVFAGAMTGNAVLCGIALLSHKSGEVWHHLTPLLAFVCGVWLAELLRERVRDHAVRLALGCEMAGVLLASFLPQAFPGDLFVFLLAFLSAFQVSSFRKTDQQSYNSTFITGNLRNAVVGLCEVLDPKKCAAGLQQSRILGMVVLSFLVGAVLSALLTPHLANHTLLLPFAALLCVLLLVLRGSAGNPPSKPTDASGKATSSPA